VTDVVLVPMSASSCSRIAGSALSAAPRFLERRGEDCDRSVEPHRVHVGEVTLPGVPAGTALHDEALGRASTLEVLGAPT
jgi:hypothetical protein